MTGWMLAALLVTRAAVAQDVAPIPPGRCPFDSVQSASATINTVTVNGTPYIVQTLPFRLGFEEALRSCGEGEAAVYFSLWRQRRRWSNISLILTLPTGGLGLIPAAWFGLRGAAYREQMLVALTPDQVT